MMTIDAWTMFRDKILPQLDAEDDANAWQAFITTIFADAEYLCRNNPHEKWIIAHIGRCSSWLRPHQTRWTADGGFAWPSGYGGVGYSRSGFPQYDWAVKFYWNKREDQWSPVEVRKRYKPHQQIDFWMIAPSHTHSHPQAAVYTEWMPGSPALPKDGLKQFYGFRKRGAVWTCTATSGSDRAYEETADAADNR